jgi:hypothetical protein
MRIGHRHRDSRIGWRRRLVAVISLAAYLTTTIGVPMPATANKEHGVPYPCQGHACGCRTAGECWDHCCCYTAEQKLAWAHEHHVKPPAHLVADVAAAQQCSLTLCSVTQSTSQSPATSAPKNACCAKHDDHHDDADHDGPSCHKHDAKSSGVTFVLGFMARKCRGQADAWCTSGAVSPPPALVAWQFHWDVVEWLSLDARPFLSSDLAPPVPPPRV